jgi:hypothetical protein
MPEFLTTEANPFEGQPHGWIQWKGTSVCMDVFCSCGASLHVDGYFAYFLRCPVCKTVFECNGHVQLVPRTEEDVGKFEIGNWLDNKTADVEILCTKEEAEKAEARHEHTCEICFQRFQCYLPECKGVIRSTCPDCSNGKGDSEEDK